MSTQTPIGDGPRLRTVRLAVPIALLLAAIGLFAGLRVGDDGGEDAPAAAAVTTAAADPGAEAALVRGGPLELALPFSWERSDEPFRDVPALSGPDAATIDADKTQIVLTNVVPADRTMLPAVVRNAAAAPLPAAERLPVGTRSASGLPALRIAALRYRGIRLQQTTRGLDAVAIPTPDGVALIACSGTDAADRTAACERALFSVTVRGTRALPVDDEAAFRAALPTEVARLAAAREADRTVLAGAKTVDGRVRAAARLRAAYRRASGTLGGMAAGADGAAGEIRALLADLAADHDALVVAARRQQRADFARAAQRIAAAERTLDDELRALLAQ